MNRAHPSLLATFSALALVAPAAVLTTGIPRWAVAAEPAASAVTSVPASDDGDLRAKALFEAQKYPDALAIYQRLYEQTHHPTYLRNLGRCYQMMRQPDPAIAWFQAYLRDARDLSAQERKEIEGYITEMRLLRAVAAPPSPAAVATQQQAPGWSPEATSTATSSATTAPGAPETASAGARRWWLWAGIGALVVGGVVAIAVLNSGSSSRLTCPAATTCGPP